MKGTRLYKPAGSPLIQGRSRRERSMAADVVSSTLVTFGVGYVATYLLWGGSGVPAISWSLSVLAVFGGAGLVGGVLGVSIARHFGWHPRWVAGALISPVAGLAALWGFVF